MSRAYFQNNIMLVRPVSTHFDLTKDSVCMEGKFKDSLRFVDLIGNEFKLVSITTNTAYFVNTKQMLHFLMNCPCNNSVFAGLFEFKSSRGNYTLALAESKDHCFPIPKHQLPVDWVQSLENLGLKKSEN